MRARTTGEYASANFGRVVSDRDELKRAGTGRPILDCPPCVSRNASVQSRASLVVAATRIISLRGRLRRVAGITKLASA
jgi:hypothetical protein